MELKKAQRQQVKLRVGLSGPSGFGKTYSALLLGYGITGDYTKIAVIDTENQSASLYSHLGEYNTLTLSPPYSPESYIKAIEMCEKAQIEVIILDRMEWKRWLFRYSRETRWPVSGLGKSHTKTSSIYRQNFTVKVPHYNYCEN